MYNLYWPVYKNLENEFLELAKYLHISDDQTQVYSMHIADLIVRCSIEIEAIAKELYAILGGNLTPLDAEGKARDLYFDTDCLELLEQTWNLSKKQVIVSSNYIYFDEEKNRILTPLHKANKRGKSGSKWKRAYQAVKHDRKKSLKKATIENLVNVMAALYILNLYYREEKIDMGRIYLNDNNFDNRVGSEIFSVCCYKATSLSMNENMDDSCIIDTADNNLDKSVYIIKYADNAYISMHKSYCLDLKETKRNFQNSVLIKKYLEQHPEHIGKNIGEICMLAGGMDLLTRIFCCKYTQKDKSGRMEAVLNKHSKIYPDLAPLDE